MAAITYSDKVALYENASVPEENKISDDNMNEIKTVVNANDTRLTTAESDIVTLDTRVDNLDNVTKYITATYVANGDFKINIPNTLETGMVVNVTFPTVATNTSNARLSIDDGVNYKNIFINNYQSIVKSIQNKSFNLRYDGTQFIIDEIEYYSTNEIKTNKVWINGKPIYRKVINTTSPSTVNNDIVIATATGADELIRLDGFISNKNIAIRPPLNFYYNDNNNAMCYFWTTNKNISMKVADTNYTSTTVTLIIEYTKTSD